MKFSLYDTGEIVMTIDYKNGLENAISNGILMYEKSPVYKEPRIFLNKEIECIDGVSFFNFPQLNAEDVSIKNCIFKDCGRMQLEDCEIEKCTFQSTEGIEFCDCRITNSCFRNLYTEYEESITLVDSVIQDCTFSDIRIETDDKVDYGTYFCVGIGSAWIEKCSFENISVAGDCGLFYYWQKKKLFRTQKDISFVDEDSCTGLNDVI